ncbi:TIGR04222 domain-containing membrane protein [Streptomyces sp. NRRL WC-3723]|uniref:TIGR04222 domain-containing membrane protein n=1 Tax=Streptomyces sp. NRRL WC-3723 TaxID=1519491 RepID=UPI00099DE78F|nr:TIGR04222 domain-containing membrane protein [Streptomyces sp. NRRL WC-3723]
MAWGILLGLCCVVTGVAGWFFRRAYRRCAEAPVGAWPEGVELGPYEVAFLSGRGAYVARTAMASMLLGGRLSVRGQVVTITDPVPRDAVEAAVIGVMGVRPRRRVWRRMDRLVRRPAIDAIGDRLAEWGLVDGSPSRVRAFGAADFLLWVAHWVSGLLGVAAVAVAAARGGPVWVVSAVVVVVMVAGARAHRHEGVGSGWLSEAGRAALAAHEARWPGGVWAPEGNDGLRGEAAVRLGKAARGGMYDELGRLEDATKWASSGSVDPGYDDPPGRGGL